MCVDTLLTLGGKVFGMLGQTTYAVQGSQMPQKSITVRPALHTEFRTMTNGVAAFSFATLLMILQGSFGELNPQSSWAAIFFLVGLPICVSASTLSFFFSHRTEIPGWADTILDSFMSLGWAGGIVGFGLLLSGVDGLLVKIFAISVAFAFVVFVLVAYFVGVSEKQSVDNNSIGSDRCDQIPENK